MMMKLVKFLDKHKVDFNDQIDFLHKGLASADDERGQKYRSYLMATYDALAIEGSLLDDEVMAALLLRERASELGIADDFNYSKLAIIRKALRVVLRRYHQSRKQRRKTVTEADFIVTPEGETTEA
jgi:hypothetical protein